MSKLREIRLSKGLTLAELARRAGTSASQVSKLENGYRQLTAQWVRRLAEALQCETEDLLAPGAGTGGPATRNKNWWAEFQSLPVFDLNARIEPDNEPMVQGALYVQAFRQDWLQALPVSRPEKLAVFRIDNDSMEPTLMPGDHVLVELSSNRLGRDGIYIVRIGQILEVKRITVNPATELVTVASDNLRYEKFVDLDPARIEAAGRVLWAGRRF